METLEMELADGVKPEAKPPDTEADAEADAHGGTAAGTTATPTEATPLSTHAQPSPLKSSPRCPARRMRSQKSDGLPGDASRQQVLREINDFDLRAIPSDVDLYGLVKDFVVPRLPQGFCVRLEQTTPVSETTGLRQRKVMFLARQTHIRLGQGGDGESGQPLLPVKPTDLSLKPKTGLGAEFLDTEEPAEMFPPLCFDKLLKFRQMAPRPSPPAHHQGYLFSQLIEDMDRLWLLQLPRDQQEELIQQISEQLSPTGSRSSEAAAAAGECWRVGKPSRLYR